MDVYVHSVGRDPLSAWPSASRTEARFVAIDQTRSFGEQISMLRSNWPGYGESPRVLFAHSANALVALAGLGEHKNHVTHLVLVEPAFYDMARGHPDIERHIEVMSRAGARARAGDYYGYWSLIRPVMFGGEATPALWTTEKHQAIKFSRRLEPWGKSLDTNAISEKSTLVVTGSWNREYEVIARRLVEECGARHLQLCGHGHRPQDHPWFGAAVRRFIGSG